MKEGILVGKAYECSLRNAETENVRMRSIKSECHGELPAHGVQKMEFVLSISPARTTRSPR